MPARCALAAACSVARPGAGETAWNRAQGRMPVGLPAARRGPWWSVSHTPRRHTRRSAAPARFSQSHTRGTCPGAQLHRVWPANLPFRQSTAAPPGQSDCAARPCRRLRSTLRRYPVCRAVVPQRKRGAMAGCGEGSWQSAQVSSFEWRSRGAAFSQIHPRKSAPWSGRYQKPNWTPTWARFWARRRLSFRTRP